MLSVEDEMNGFDTDATTQPVHAETPKPQVPQSE